MSGLVEKLRRPPRQGALTNSRDGSEQLAQTQADDSLIVGVKVDR